MTKCSGRWVDSVTQTGHEISSGKKSMQPDYHVRCRGRVAARKASKGSAAAAHRAHTAYQFLSMTTTSPPAAQGAAVEAGACAGAATAGPGAGASASGKAATGARSLAARADAPEGAGAMPWYVGDGPLASAKQHAQFVSGSLHACKHAPECLACSHAMDAAT